MPFDIEDRLTQTPQAGPRARRPAARTPVVRRHPHPRSWTTTRRPARVIQAALANRDFVIDVVSDPALVESALPGRTSYHLIILDYVLPGLEADQVFAWIRDSQPDANIVVVTGYPSVDSALTASGPGPTTT